MNYINLYVKFLKRFWSVKAPIEVVFDCSNGTTGPVLKRLLRGEKLVKYRIINSKPDGNFPAHNPNPLHSAAERQAISLVLKTRADLGVIFDGDGDRIVFIDNLGRVVDPRRILCLLAPRFAGPYVVSTALGKETMRWLSPKSKFIEELTGRYFIKRTAQRKGIGLSVERSGHYFFKDFHYADSGLLASIFVINQLSSLKLKNIDFSDWLLTLPKLYTTGELNLKVKNKNRLVALLKKRFSKKGYRLYRNDGITVVGGNIWLNARRSNTEPVVRVELASPDKESFYKHKKILTSLDFGL